MQSLCGARGNSGDWRHNPCPGIGEREQETEASRGLRAAAFCSGKPPRSVGGRGGCGAHPRRRGEPRRYKKAGASRCAWTNATPAISFTIQFIIQNWPAQQLLRASAPLRENLFPDAACGGDGRCRLSVGCAEPWSAGFQARLPWRKPMASPCASWLRTAVAPAAPQSIPREPTKTRFSPASGPRLRHFPSTQSRGKRAKVRVSTACLSPVS